MKLPLPVIAFCLFVSGSVIANAQAQDSPPPKAEEPVIDFAVARTLLGKERSGQSLSQDERRYLDRAKTLRQKQNQDRAEAADAKQRPAPERLIPLTDMSAEDRYEGEDGGLYGGGRNTPPESIAKTAQATLAKIHPLDGTGKPSVDGSIVFVSISMSNATQEFSRFKELADRSPAKSERVTIVDCAQGGQAMAQWVPPDARPWQVALQRLAAANVTPEQVQVAWVKLANMGPTGSLEDHGKKLESDTLKVLHNARVRFPNLKVAYLGSRIWAGNATSRLNPEPYAYESAFVVRWLIRRQMEGDAELAFIDTPLLLWGPYLWAEGTRGRKVDSLQWERADFAGDGVHPSNSGRQKVAEQLLDFVTTNPLAKPWFTVTNDLPLSPDAGISSGGEPFAVTPFGTRITAKQAFARLDVDTDGKVTATEFQRSPGMGNAAKALAVVRKVDQDGDGSLSFIEFNNVFAQRHGGETSTNEATVEKSSAEKEPFKVIGYQPSWAGDVDTIPYDQLTHINYSFILPKSDGTFKDMPRPARLTKLVERAHANKVKVGIAIGGWNGGNDSAFEELAASPETRKRFVSETMNLVKTFGLDGVDMDWEYPDAGESSANFLSLMRDLSAELRGENKYLSVAVVSQGRTGSGIKAEVFPLIDMLNIMAYDGNAHGLYSQAETSIRYWSERGCPKEKLILGLPFYGRSPYRAYRHLVREDPAAPAKDVVGEIRYNGIATMKKKTRLGMEKGGGVMIWELSQDVKGKDSLLGAVSEVIAVTR